MNHTGMTSIVKTTTKLISGFIVVFGLHIAITGHLGPGGGFAGGVILAAAAVLVVLAFGHRFTAPALSEARCHVWDAGGAMAFLVIALGGYFVGSFFFNFINEMSRSSGGAPIDRLGRLFSSGTLPLANLAIFLKVGAGLAGAFLALSLFRAPRGQQEIDSWA